MNIFFNINSIDDPFGKSMIYNEIHLYDKVFVKMAMRRFFSLVTYYYITYSQTYRPNTHEYVMIICINLVFNNTHMDQKYHVNVNNQQNYGPKVMILLQLFLSYGQK